MVKASGFFRGAVIIYAFGVTMLLLGGCTSLNRELAGGRVDNVREMLANNEGDVNQVYSLIGWTPLMYASRLGAVDVVETLLAKGARTNIQDTWGNRATHHATAAPAPSDYVITKLLIERGEPVDVISSRGYTLLHTAFSSGGNAVFGKRANLGLVRFLIDHGAPVDLGTTSSGAWYSIVDGEQQGHTPLMLAAKWGQPEIVELLLSKGADPNKQTVYGWTALHYAVGKINTGVASMLLDAGAKPTQVSNSAFAAEMTGRLFTLVGLRFAVQGDKESASQSLRIANSSFEQAASNFSSEANQRTATVVLANVLSFGLAATQARISAQQMAASSPTGKGVGVAMYQTGDVSQPLKVGRTRSEAALLELQATSSMLQCVDSATDADGLRACLPPPSATN